MLTLASVEAHWVELSLFTYLLSTGSENAPAVNQRGVLHDFGAVYKCSNWLNCSLICSSVNVDAGCSADDSFRNFVTTQAIVTSRGDVLWMFPAVIKVYCTLDVRHFPFDNQRCPVVFISWTFNGFKLNVTYNESEPQIIYYTPRNQVSIHHHHHHHHHRLFQTQNP